MKKKTSYRWLIWIILAVVLIGVALMHILPPYIDRWKSARDYDKLAEEYVNDESEPDDGKQKKKDWWATDVKVEFDKLKAENPDVIGWIRFDNQATATSQGVSFWKVLTNLIFRIITTLSTVTI